MTRLMRAAAMSLALAAGAAPAAGLAQEAVAAPGAGDAAFRATTLQLQAYGETRLAPDTATLALGVTTEAPSAEAAMQANAARMTEVLAALRRAGLGPKDLQTARIGVEPQYAYDQDKPPRLTGYRASNQVSVTLHDLARLGATLDAAIAAGANQAGGVSFGLADETAAENAAREAAVKALAAKADLYARATGYRVLRLVSLSEGVGSGPPLPAPMVTFAAARKSVETPVAPGEVRVRIDVTGVYELAR
jgi:uncharacterized protein YggE